jgi:hypothetical protein
LERRVGALDSSDEPCDFVSRLCLISLDALALAVEAADEAHLREQIGGGMRDEVEHAVLLSDLRR